jgi:tripartite-type tricarboxylate transporter receptor subunit TctC
MQEAGVRGYELQAWWGAWLPPNTPAPIVGKLAGWLNEILATEETKAFLARSATDPWPGSPKQLAELVPKEVEKWGKLMREANIQPVDR